MLRGIAKDLSTAVYRPGRGWNTWPDHELDHQLIVGVCRHSLAKLRPGPEPNAPQVDEKLFARSGRNRH